MIYTGSGATLKEAARTLKKHTKSPLIPLTVATVKWRLEKLDLFKAIDNQPIKEILGPERPLKWGIWPKNDCIFGPDTL